ncbi:MAG: VWA domain-containing protein [Alphaproteobacteria bacterium]|nr:VWA domain-containing protein [Alphaproteobacteria bacterium]
MGSRSTARGYTAKSKLQGAVDAAALAGAKAYLGNTVDASDEARMFFDANYADDFMGGSVVTFDASINEQSENMVVQATVSIPTTFMQIFGFNQLTLGSAAEVSASHTNLELALVVDVTGSMNSNDSNGDVKIDSLKTAGNTLLQSIYGEYTTLPGVYISLVPYRHVVNIGDRESWLTGYTASDYNPYGWTGCVFARNAPADQNDNPPNSTANRFEPYFWPSAHWYGTWWIDDYFAPYNPNKYCPVDEIISLTDQRATIEAGINGLDAQSGGGTQTAVGLAWGWRTISSLWRGQWHGPTPNDMPLDYDEPDLIKAVVFMTDGIADIGWEPMAYGFLSEGNLGTTNEALAEAEVNARLSTICEAMKTEGILIFSVTFAVTDPGIESTYRDCATQPDYFFNSPTGDELETAFEQIGRRLASLRLTQ